MSRKMMVATRNAHKLEEIGMILSEVEVCGVESLEDAPDVEETGVTFLENATLKAVAISKVTDEWVLSDDSGLEVDALNGEPGVYSSRYAGVEGDDAGNNEKLLGELSGQSDRSGRFRCVMVIALQGEVLAHFSGHVEGRILEERHGTGGFGYDPLFVPEGYEKSFAELGDEIKNKLSHRANALKGVKKWIQENS